MPLTTGYSFGDVVLVPFPFTDQSGSKKRPAVIVSSAEVPSPSSVPCSYYPARIVRGPWAV